MILNHLNLAVTDVACVRDFFITNFGLTCSEEKGNNTLTVLRDEGGFVLILTNFANATDVTYPNDFHIGFICDTRRQVDEMHQKLVGNGFDIKPPRHLHGGWSFYVNIPGNSGVVEVVSYEA